MGIGDGAGRVVVSHTGGGAVTVHRHCGTWEAHQQCLNPDFSRARSSETEYGS